MASTSSPSNPPKYNSPSFWNRRYGQSAGVFDWYQSYSDLRRLIRSVIPVDADILQIGVGTSNLQADMVADGYKGVTSIDISKVSVGIMSERHKDISELRYLQADCRCMSDIKSGSYSIILDKGTLDALLCGSRAREDVDSTLKEVYRVLRQNGRFVLISLGPPGHRLEFLESSVYPFAILVYGIAKPGWDPYDTDASTSEDEDSCRFVGPFDVEDPAQYEKLLDLKEYQDKLHWMYVCQKLEHPPGPPAGSAPASPEPVITNCEGAETSSEELD